MEKRYKTIFKKKSLKFGALWGLLAVLLLPFAYSLLDSSISQSSSQIISNSLLIDVPQEKFYKKNTNIFFHVHVFNSTGLLLNGTSTSCKFHLYNQSGQHLIIADLGNDFEGFNITIGNNITKNIGEYPFDIWCNATQTGGFISSEIIINSTGTQTKDNFLIGIILTFGIGIFFLILLSNYVRVEPLKYLLISISAILFIILINIILTISGENFTSINLLVSTTYLVVLYTLEFVLGIGIIYLMFYYTLKLVHSWKYKNAK